MNIRDLEYLVALHDERHFGRAAAACFVSQPTLSMQVKKLEVHLGVALIERSPRAVLFTAAGEAVVARARSVLSKVHEIEAVAERARNPRSGSLRLGAFPTLAPYLLPHIMQPLQKAFPDIEFLLAEDKTAVLVERLRSGALDAVMVASPFSGDDAGVAVEPLFTEPFDLAVPTQHPLATGPTPPTMSSLNDEPVLLLEDGHCLRDQALDVCAAVGAREHEGFRATSLETLRYMVASGVGITLLPRLATLPPVATVAGLEVRPFSGTPPHREIVLAWRSSSPRDDVLREIAAEIRRAVPVMTGQPA